MGVARNRQLNAQQQRFEAPQEHEAETGDQVENADVFVVDRGDPAQQAGRSVRLDYWRGIRRGDCCHDNYFKLSR